MALRYDCDLPYDAIEEGGSPIHPATLQIGGDKAWRGKDGDLQHVCVFHASKLVQEWAAGSSPLTFVVQRIKGGGDEGT